MRRRVRFTGVHGTWHRNAPWLKPGSHFLLFMAQLGVVPLHPTDPYQWSGDANGWQFWRRWGLGSKDGDRGDWMVGGSSLRWKLQGEAYPNRGLIVHSHGLWPAVEAIAQGLSVPWMISIGSPARWDLDDRVRLALPRLGAWLHIYDLERDKWGFRGAIGDGKLNLERAQRFAGVHNLAGRIQDYAPALAIRGGNDALTGIDHSKVLTDPTQLHYWQDRRWIDFMDRGTLR